MWPHESIEATLALLLGALKSLTTDLKEVQADNQQLLAVPTNQSPIKEVPVPSIHWYSWVILNYAIGYNQQD